MKLTSQAEKWVGGILGVVCVILLINLALNFGNARVGASRSATTVSPATEARRQPAARPGRGEELSHYDPMLRLALLKQLESRRLPEIARNPFEFETRPAAPGRGVTAATSAPLPPTAPPPPPLKAMGYAEKAGGVREAYLVYEDQIYVVHEAESFAKRFRVLKITSALAEIKDESTQQTVKLPIPQ